MNNISILKKETLTVFRSVLLEEKVKNDYNLISFGTPRGGTSIIGTLMTLFEFEMGDNVHPTVHEDMSFEGIPINQWDKIIQNKILKNKNWSLKMPIASQCLKTFEKNLPNPVFLMIFRNPFSVAESLIKHDPNFQLDHDSYQKALENSLNDYMAFQKYLKEINVPIIVTEHEKIIKNPESFIRELIKILNIKTDEKIIETAINLISTPGYKRIDN